MFSRRFSNFLAFLGAVTLLCIAYFYMERYLFLTPCPLCYAQRIVVGLVGFWFLLACLFPGGKTAGSVYAKLIFLTSAFGAALSIRHLYLQSQPKGSMPMCGEDFYQLVKNTPIGEAVHTMILGSGECGDVQWTMLGLSIPGWTLIAFIGFAFWGVLHNAFRQR